MPLTYSVRTRKDKGKTLSSFFPRSTWDKVGEREEKKSRRKRKLVAVTSNIPPLMAYKIKNLREKEF